MKKECKLCSNYLFGECMIDLENENNECDKFSFNGSIEDLKNIPGIDISKEIQEYEKETIKLIKTNIESMQKNIDSYCNSKKIANREIQSPYCLMILNRLDKALKESINNLKDLT